MGFILSGLIRVLKEAYLSRWKVLKTVKMQLPVLEPNYLSQLMLEAKYSVFHFNQFFISLLFFFSQDPSAVPNSDNAFTLFYVKFRAAAPKVRVSQLAGNLEIKLCSGF